MADGGSAKAEAMAAADDIWWLRSNDVTEWMMMMFVTDADVAAADVGYLLQLKNYSAQVLRLLKHCCCSRVLN